MEFKDIVSISGKGGLFQLEANRANGSIVSDLADGKKSFVSTRQHFITPLENITIYTDDEPRELRDIFVEMKNRREEIAPADPRANPEDLRGYFEKIVPNYDSDRVYISDIKKMMRWFAVLDGMDLIHPAEDETKAESDEEKNDSGEAMASTDAAADEGEASDSDDQS